MPKFVRAREGTGMLVHPDSGTVAAPDPSRPIPDSDPLVKKYPWAFVSDEDLAAEQASADVAWRESAIESARRADEALAEREKAAKEADADAEKMAEARANGKPQGDDAERDIRTGDTVESATAAPGEKRTVRKASKKA